MAKGRQKKRPAANSLVGAGRLYAIMQSVPLYFLQALQGVQGFSCLKKSLPLSSTRMNAGKSSTVIFQMASMPSSGYSTHSMLLMLLCDRTAATPPMVPR